MKIRLAFLGVLLSLAAPDAFCAERRAASRRWIRPSAVEGPRVGRVNPSGYRAEPAAPPALLPPASLIESEALSRLAASGQPAPQDRIEPRTDTVIDNRSIAFGAASASAPIAQSPKGKNGRGPKAEHGHTK